MGLVLDGGTKWGKMPPSHTFVLLPGCWFSVAIIKACIPLLTFTKSQLAMTRSQINLHLFSSTPLILNNGNED